MTGPHSNGPHSNGPAPRCVVAVDWSGAADAETGVHEKLWVAEAVDGELRGLEPSSRTAACDRIVERAAEWGSGLLAGLDVGFAYPAWFLDELGVPDGPGLWAAAAAADGPFPDTSRPPFFGRRGSTAPPLDRRYRACELAARAVGLPAKPTFQVGGAGAVGTGTWRALPHLHRLVREGLSVWSFDRPVAAMTDRAVVAEVYPRMHTGPVVKSRFLAREQRWAELVAEWDLAVEPRTAARALSSENAFDAAVTALALARSGPVPPPPVHPLVDREGWILGLAPTDRST